MDYLNPTPFRFDHRVLDALDDIKLSSSGNIKSFHHIEKELVKSAKLVSGTISNQNKKNRENDNLISQRMETLWSSTSRQANDRLDNIDQSIIYAGEGITNGLDRLRIQLGYELVNINATLQGINNQITISNNILTHIGNSFNSLISLIKIPNEIKALERADEARINLAISKLDKALKCTEQAINLCSTSIPVISYHIISLCAQKEVDSYQEVKSNLIDLSNIISFKLLDPKHEKQNVMRDINLMLYPLLEVVANRFGSGLLSEIEELYKSIATDEDAIFSFIIESINNKQCNQMMNSSSMVRELHWSVGLDVILKHREHIDKKLSHVARYLNSVDLSRSPITYELILQAGKRSVENEILQRYLIKSQNGEIDKASENAIKIIIRSQPQSYYELGPRVLTMMAEFADKTSYKCNPQFRESIDSNIGNIQHDFVKEYVSKYEEFKNKINQCEGSILEKLRTEFNQSKSSLIEEIDVSKSKIRQLKTEKEFIETEIHKLKGKVPDVSKYENNPMVLIGIGIIIVFILVSIIGDIEGGDLFVLLLVLPFFLLFLGILIAASSAVGGGILTIFKKISIDTAKRKKNMMTETISTKQNYIQNIESEIQSKKRGISDQINTKISNIESHVTKLKSFRDELTKELGEIRLLLFQKYYLPGVTNLSSTLLGNRLLELHDTTGDNILSISSEFMNEIKQIGSEMTALK